MSCTTLFDNLGNPLPIPAECEPDFLEYAVKRRLITDKGWICASCGGAGWYYDPNDPPDDYEGNKMRDRLKCSACNRTGINQNSRKDYEESYKRILRQNEIDREKWHEAACRYQELLNQLGSDNIREIKELAGFELKPLA